MKIPGIGEVKPAYVYAGVGAVGLTVVYGLYKKRKSASANAANAAAATAATQNQDNGNVDPVTGVDYSAEGGVYGYGAVDPQTGVPYQYESNTTSSTTNYTTNTDWANAAIIYAQSDLGATQALAQQAIQDYLEQNAAGLPASEYELMSEIIALVGPPPVGTFRLHESVGSTGIGGGNPPSGGTGTPTGTTKALAPGEVIQVQDLIRPPNTMQSTADHFAISLQHLINNNPGTSASYTGVVNIPVLVRQGDTLTSIAARFGISPEHLAMELSSQGII